MIERLRGKVLEKTPEYISLDVAGIIFGLNVTLTTYMDSPEPGSQWEVFVDLIMGEKEVELYGFSTPDEREFFRKLRKIRGVGPRMARNLLSGLSTEELIRAVEDADIQTISGIPGIGIKTAKRLVVELRDVAGKVKMPATSPYIHQAIEALINLGFNRRDAEKAVASVKEKKISLEELIRRALRVLVKERRDS